MKFCDYSLFSRRFLAHFCGLILFFSLGVFQEVRANTALGDLFSNDCIIDIDFDFSTTDDKSVFSGPGLKRGAKLVKCKLDEGVSKEEDLKVLIIGWTRFLLSLTATVAVVAIIWAGFLYVTAAGDDTKTESAKKIVMWVALGIVLILGAYAIVNTIMHARFGA